MKYKKLDQFIDGSVAVIIINGLLLFILNMCVRRLLKSEQFSGQPGNPRAWISKLSHMITFSGLYQYIYIMPIIIWQVFKKRFWLVLGMFAASLLTALLYKIILLDSLANTLYLAP